MKKKIILLFIIVGVISTTFLACKKDSKISTNGISQSHNMPPPLTSVSNSIDYWNIFLDSIGVLHNQALDYAFNQLKTNQEFKGLDTIQNITYCKNYVNQFFGNYFTNAGFTYLNDQALQNLDLMMHTSFSSIHFSDQFLSKKTQLDNNFQDATSPSAFKSYVYGFLDNALTTLDSNEKIAFKAYALVLANSYQYWTDNGDKWANEYNKENNISSSLVTPMTNKPRKINGKDVAKADAESAASGAVIGAATGSCLAGPVGTVAGGFVSACEGAAIGSLTNIIFQLFVW